MKFNWSHGHSTPKLVKVHGGKLGDTYFKPLPTNYKIVWKVRNEDFFALRWGVPDFIRQHIALNGVQDYVGGYFIGSETYIPALDYFTAIERSGRLEVGLPASVVVLQTLGPTALRPGDAGRGVPGRVHAPLRRQARRQPAEGVFTRLDHAAAARVAVRLAMGFHALQRRHSSRCRARTRTTSASTSSSISRRWTRPMSPSRDYVKTHARRRFVRGRTHHAAATDRSARTRQPRGAAPGRADRRRDNASLMYEVADVQDLGVPRPAPGRETARRRGAADLSRRRRRSDQAAGDRSSADRRSANWDEVIAITRPIYRDMKLTHYNGNSFDANPDNLFHWARIRAAGRTRRRDRAWPPPDPRRRK